MAIGSETDPLRKESGNLIWHKGALAKVPAVLYTMLQCTLRQAVTSFHMVYQKHQHLRLLYYIMLSLACMLNKS